MIFSSLDTALAPYAQKNSTSQGRRYPEPEAEDRAPYQRDRDRIIHTASFRRLQGKTQVVTPTHGDHYRNRLTHTIEVAQIARDMARWFGLNEDLAEAIALAHDLGHPPFGHGGESALRQKMEDHGGTFEHNEQSLRIVTLFENRYPDFRGLNLTLEVLEGLQKHSSHFERPNKRVIYSPHLEAQLVDISDEITYLAADLEDGLRGGFFEIDDLQNVPLINDVLESLTPKEKTLRSCVIRRTIKHLLRQLMIDTKANLKRYTIQTLEDVQKTPDPIVFFEKDFYKEFLTLKQFLMEKYYTHPQVKSENEHGQEAIRSIFDACITHPTLLPKRFIPEEKNHPQRVCDYIAGMTDTFALAFLQDTLNN